MVWVSLLGGIILFLLPMVAMIYFLTPGHDLSDISWNIDSRSVYHSGMRAATLRGVMMNVEKPDEMHNMKFKDLEEIHVSGISDLTGPVTDQSYSVRAEMWKHGKIFYPKLLHYPPDSASVPTGIRYPTYHNLSKIIEEWNPDDPDPPSHFVETLQHFNYSDDRERAMAANFRNHEVPFKLYNVPEFERVRRKWTDEYLNSVLGDNEAVHVERSDTNHFMYWNGHKKEGWEPPTDVLPKGELMWREWLEKAKKADIEKLTTRRQNTFILCTTPSKGIRRAPSSLGISLYFLGARRISLSRPRK